MIFFAIFFLSNNSLYFLPSFKAKSLLFSYFLSNSNILFDIDIGSGSQIKFCGENSFEVKLSEQVIGIDPHIIPSIMGKPNPSALDGKRINFEELYNTFKSLSGTTPK